MLHLTDVTFSRLFRWPIVPMVRTTDVEADVECYRLSTIISQIWRFDYEHNYINITLELDRWHIYPMSRLPIVRTADCECYRLSTEQSLISHIWQFDYKDNYIKVAHWSRK